MPIALAVASPIPARQSGVHARQLRGQVVEPARHGQRRLARQCPRPRFSRKEQLGRRYSQGGRQLTECRGRRSGIGGDIELAVRSFPTAAACEIFVDRPEHVALGESAQQPQAGEVGSIWRLGGVGPYDPLRERIKQSFVQDAADKRAKRSVSVVQVRRVADCLKKCVAMGKKSALDDGEGGGDRLRALALG